MATAHISSIENFFINDISYSVLVIALKKGGVEASPLDEQR